MKKRILTALLAATMTLSVPALAAGGETVLADSEGNIYTLSSPVLDTYQGENCPYGGESTYTVYVVEYGSRITCPDGMIFTGGYFDPEDPDARWPESYYRDGYPYAGVSSRTFKNEEKLLQCAKGTDSSRMDSVPVKPSAHIHIHVAASFTDVPYDAYYSDPVLWAMAEEITQGTGNNAFSPDLTCSRGQIITFLWRQNRSRKPTLTENPFTDVAPGSYYYDACLWAYEKGMVSGPAFSPDEPCTRAMAVEFMWRLAGCVKVKEPRVFEDVPSDASYASAVAWAEKAGITDGTSPTAFSPQAVCTRAQIVTLMYRGVDAALDMEDIDFSFTGAPVVPRTYASVEELKASLSEEAREYVEEDGLNALTDPAEVNAACQAGKLHQTIGYDIVPNRNGYRTGATLDVSGAVLDHEALAILNRYRAARFINMGSTYDPASMDLQWTVGDIGEETALACAKYAKCADYCYAITVQAGSLEEALAELDRQGMLSGFLGLRSTHAVAAHYTDARGKTTYAFLYLREHSAAGLPSEAADNYGY